MSDRSGTAYEQWAAREGIPIIRGYAVEDMYKVPLEPWQRKGGKGAFIILEGGEGVNSAYICEIPPGASLKPQRHLFEERIYILQGRGETKVWNEGGEAQTIPWREYSLFSPPLNTWHQHTNTGDQPAKYVAVTDAPLVFNIYRNPDFVFDTNFVFTDRYKGEVDYFDGVGKMVEERAWRGAYIPDVRKMNMYTTVEYGKGFSTLVLQLSRNTLRSRLAQVDVGTYKKPHRHGSAAHIIVVQGTGYALMWKEWGERVRTDFQKGSIYCPPEAWWHTHCNTGTEAVKQVIFSRPGTAIGKIYQFALGIKKGGDMLEREDEPPGLRQLFEEELTKKGLKSQMSFLR